MSGGKGEGRPRWRVCLHTCANEMGKMDMGVCFECISLWISFPSDSLVQLNNRVDIFEVTHQRLCL